MKNIVVPVDFSNASICAANYAAKFCKFIGGELHLLNVFHLPNPIKSLPIELIITRDEINDSTHSQLKEIKELLEKSNENCPTIHIASRNGNTIEEINNFGEYISGDIIIAGLKFNNPEKLDIGGSIIYRLLRHAKLPILIIPEGYEFIFPEIIVYSADGKAHHNSIEVQQVKSIADAFKAKLIIEHIGEHIDSDMKNGIIKQQDLVFGNTTHAYIFEENNNVTDALMDITTNKKNAILVMTQNKHDLIERFSGFDQTQLIAASTKIPMMILHES